MESKTCCALLRGVGVVGGAPVVPDGTLDDDDGGEDDEAGADGDVGDGDAVVLSPACVDDG